MLIVDSYPVPIPAKHYRELYELFGSLSDAKEAKMLLEDILTPAELDSLAERWQLVKELHKGKPQRQIAKELGVSICKITKGSRVLKYGSGGLKHFLEKEKK